ncbi:MAG: zinc ABC transporter solute-binding protein [Chloroflexi bacterium]|nr:zinc ABC transporter solute-binding protein [Chloroflexota bacterium]
MILSFVTFLTGCTAELTQGETAVSTTDLNSLEILSLPELDAVELDGALLKVVATTSIIGDVVAQVGGDTIELTTLINPGQDPHSYEPGARMLTAVANTNIIFVNGWDLEESLLRDLKEIGEDAPIVPISANITPLAFGENTHNHDHDEQVEYERRPHSADPHVWLNIQNVKQWVDNVEHILSQLDPINANSYANNAAAYLVQLNELEAYAESQLGSIPTENRFIVTNHDALGYFVHAYDLTILGTVIPGLSTLAEPSAKALTNLIKEMEEHAVCTLFTETTVSDSLIQTVADELTLCAEVKVLQLYTGAIGPINSGTDSYIGMFRANVDTVTSGLK